MVSPYVRSVVRRGGAGPAQIAVKAGGCGLLNPEIDAKAQSFNAPKMSSVPTLPAIY
jgi:pseudouridine-5'-phosphate glycosidase